jgi:hypothetical protein
MSKGYANIACTVGRVIKERLRIISVEPLPQRLALLVSKLNEGPNSKKLTKEASRRKHWRED